MSSRRENFLPGFKQLGARQFGGALLKGNPRSARPLSTKRPMHLVMRSTMAIGDRSFLEPKRAQRIEKMVHRLGKQQGVKIFRFANSGNHLHLLVLPRSRKAFHNFVRSVSGVAARLSLGKERGKAAKPQLSRSKKKVFYKSKNSDHSAFWDARPFTRIVEWGREFNTTRKALEHGGSRKNSISSVLNFWPRELSESTA
jgi:REP element-mobilizing transposase RayT